MKTMKTQQNVNEPLTASDLFAPLRDQLRIQGSDGNWNYDAYMQGMYNGLECALATLEHREPQYRSKPEGGWIHDRIPKDFVPQVCDAVLDDGANVKLCEEGGK